jgi:hypothetical protein
MIKFPRPGLSQAQAPSHRDCREGFVAVSPPGRVAAAGESVARVRAPGRRRLRTRGGLSIMICQWVSLAVTPPGRAGDCRA